MTDHLRSQKAIGGDLAGERIQLIGDRRIQPGVAWGKPNDIHRDVGDPPVLEDQRRRLEQGLVRGGNSGAAEAQRGQKEGGGRQSPNRINLDGAA
jgi:hypothetical protein